MIEIKNITATDSDKQELSIPDVMKKLGAYPSYSEISKYRAVLKKRLKKIHGCNVEVCFELKGG
jgi:capsular polysaccharide biosynthesis protein